MTASPAPHYMTTEEVAERFRTSPGTVRYWRHVGKGPDSFRVGARVLYDQARVEAWETEQQATQYAAATPRRDEAAPTAPVARPATAAKTGSARAPGHKAASASGGRDGGGAR